MTMSKEHVVRFGVCCVLLFQLVLASVPSPTNLSVVCHNFVNVLYWNYSNPTEQLTFSVTVKPYVSDHETADTSQTYLDISNYSRDVEDDYLVYVMAHDGLETSENISIRFTYSQDYSHYSKCSLDFPAVNTSVHKDVVEVTFQHPYILYKQDMLKDEFVYTIKHNEHTVSYWCFEDEELCTENIHLNQSAAGQCVELMFEGKIAGIPSETYRNVCVPLQTSKTVRSDFDVDNTGIIAALLAGGSIVLFIAIGFAWLFCRKFFKGPQIPQFLRTLPGQSLTTQPESTTVSKVTPQGHTPLLNENLFSFSSTPSSPTEIDRVNTNLEDTVEDLREVSAEDIGCEDSGGFGRPSDYDSPKFLQEMSPEDFTEGYGPRPPVL